MGRFDLGTKVKITPQNFMQWFGQSYRSPLLTVGPGVSDTEFLSENPGFWPNLVQMVSISLKVTTIQIEPQMVPLGATRGRSFFYYMKIEGSKPAIYE